MPGKNKTPLLGWHPVPAELGDWARAEAHRQGIPLARLLDEAVTEYRSRPVVTVVCPEHEPGGRVLAEGVPRAQAREAVREHCQATGHSQPWVMDPEHWDWLTTQARRGP
jgi:hypothetical protein